jgi:hypothetical protein
MIAASTMRSAALALQILIWDVKVPSAGIDVPVADGWVTLKGDVDYQFQSDVAFDDIASIHGGGGLTNEIKVVNPCRWACSTHARAPFWAGATPAGCHFSNCRLWPLVEVLSGAHALGPRFSLLRIPKGVPRLHECNNRR